MKATVLCDWCGKVFYRYPSQIKNKKVRCCSKECLAKYMSKECNPDGYRFRDFSINSRRMSELNRKINPDRMRIETRLKLREARLGSGKGRSYRKFLGRHEHRIIAELMMGRPLRKGEVVHHIDGDKLNNRSDNLMVFASQAEHARHHKKAGDAR